MKKILVSLVMVLIALSVSAVPAKPGQKRLLTLADGTTVTAQLTGDEHVHYWLADDGRAYVESSVDNVFERADLQQLKLRGKARREQSNARRAKRLGSKKVGEVSSYVGKKRGLIILVNFSTTQFKEENDRDLYERIANEKNFNHGSFQGSMYDYFYAQSEGIFELNFDVVGPYTVSQPYSYYGKNDSQGNDMYPAEMVIEALELADDDVNYADYDWNGNGEVDQVYVVYCGKGEANGGAKSTIWPHEWELSSAAYYGDGSGAQTLDGVRIDTYACGAELNGMGTIDGIGTMCHEFSHCLGYPDFYDTDYSGGPGMYCWDLMDMGSYNGDGFLPAGYTGYERWVAGWRQPVELKKTTSVSNLKALPDGGESYIIYNDAHPDEFFMLENRQQVGWDSGLPCSGMLIVHCDYDATVWANNQPNDDPRHQRMSWVPADGKIETYSYGGNIYVSESGLLSDLYPSKGVNSFGLNAQTTQAFFNKTSDGTYDVPFAVENITQNSDGTISFDFKGMPTLPKPTFTPEPGLYETPQSVSISCDSANVDIYYTLDGTDPTAESTLYEGPFEISETTTVKAIAINADEETSPIASARYVIRSIEPCKVNTFRRVNSVDEMVSGKYYIIACSSKKRAAAPLGTKEFLSVEEVDVDEDVITINDNVQLFYVEGSDDSFSFCTEQGQYLYAKAIKKLSYGDEPYEWTLSDHDSGVVMTFGSYGTMLYNVNSPRFTTYTSSPNVSMVRANLYMEFELPEKQDVSMAFSANEISITLGDEWTAPTLTTEPEGLKVSYTSSDESIATVDAKTGEVTLVGQPGTTTITATFAGNIYYNAASASYQLEVLPKPQQEAELSFSETEVTTVAECQDFVAPTLINPHDVAVVYSSSDESFATVDAQTGQVTIGSNVGTVVITATFDGNDDYLPGSASYTIIINENPELGIIQIDNGKLIMENEAVYDLSGRKWSMKNGHLPKGIYIVGGRKVVVK